MKTTIWAQDRASCHCSAWQNRIQRPKINRVFYKPATATSGVISMASSSKATNTSNSPMTLKNVSLQGDLFAYTMIWEYLLQLPCRRGTPTQPPFTSKDGDTKCVTSFLHWLSILQSVSSVGAKNHSLYSQSPQNKYFSALFCSMWMQEMKIKPMKSIFLLRTQFNLTKETRYTVLWKAREKAQQFVSSMHNVFKQRIHGRVHRTFYNCSNHFTSNCFGMRKWKQLICASFSK